MSQQQYDVTVCIPTKNRYDCLDKALLSMALQTYKPKKIVVVDDSDNPQDIRNIPHYAYILQLLLEKGIDWDYMFGMKQGQHFSHQYVQEIAKTDLIFRIDDDEVAEPDCLKRLVGTMKADSKLGAVAPSVTLPNPSQLPVGLRNRITDLNRPNMQWYKGEGTYDADHLYSCFLYKKGIAQFDLTLSPAAHREETIFSYSIKRAGYTLAVNMDAKVYHFREEKGGIRANPNPQFWESDERHFNNLKNQWGINKGEKMVILDNGIGDHYAFKNILPDLKKKYKNLTIAATFPNVFYDETGFKMISIAEAKLMYGDISNYNIYKFMPENNWKQSLTEAFKQFYLDEDSNLTFFQQATVGEIKSEKLSGGVLETGYKRIV
jgi:glycosyltransferase involved in cell wall biosynthesis